MGREIDGLLENGDVRKLGMAMRAQTPQHVERNIGRAAVTHEPSHGNHVETHGQSRAREVRKLFGMGLLERRRLRSPHIASERHLLECFCGR